MKSLTLFLQHVLTDVGTWCCTSTIRDFKTATERIEHEGMSFLTITLANFGKDFEKSLDLGFVDHDRFAGFQRSGGLPRFLGGFLDQVFDRCSGRLLDNPSVTAIWAIRQITLMWAKINLPCSDARERAAIGRYVECEKDVRESDATVDPTRVNRYNRIGTLLWANAFSDADRKVYEGDVRPKHGPGATQDRLRGNAKWVQQEWTERLEQVFPHWEYLVSGWSLLERLTDVRILEPGTERPVRVITVPKTLKTPRIIAVEPTCMQFMQQGLLGALGKSLQADDIAWKLVGWSSQVPNQHLARQGSQFQALATLDLSEASDRVSNQHVRGLLRNHPHLAAGVDSSRSRKADVPGHGVIRLAKFASMGSALCFPFEAMVFTTMIFVGIEEQLNRPITRKDIKSFLGQVRVYGDDIVVPVEFVHSVMRVLEDFGLRVNRSKSFWNGKFRESCGKEYYDGQDVSIVRIRAVLPTSRTHVSEIVSTVSTRNQAYKAGLWNTVRYLDDLLGELIPLPRVSETSPVLGRHSFLGADYSGKLHPDTHAPLVRGYVVRSRIPVSRLDDYGALLKCLTLGESSSSSDITDLPFSDVGHLERAGRPQAVDIKLRWGPAA